MLVTSYLCSIRVSSPKSLLSLLLLFSNIGLAKVLWKPIYAAGCCSLVIAISDLMETRAPSLALSSLW